MPTQISKVLGVTHKKLDEIGIFDKFIDIDSLLHVDPYLLNHSDAPEMNQAFASVEKYWEDTLKIIANISSKDGPFYKQALKNCGCPEDEDGSLGYGSKSKGGSGIGPKLAEEILITAMEIIKVGVNDPTIFQLIGMFQEDIGADRISDMTIKIIKPFICKFTQRIARTLNIPTKVFSVEHVEYKLPFNRATNARILLFPRDILRKLSVALDWSDIDRVSKYNSELRSRVNNILGSSWGKAVKKWTKSQLKAYILKYPEVLTDLIRQYREKKAKAYDFNADLDGELAWKQIAESFTTKFALTLPSNKPKTIDDLKLTVKTIIDKFKSLVENNGMNIFFYTDKKKLRHERFAQRLFFGIASIYCEANNYDISPESNAGRGAVDFKLSHGASVKSIIEIKWSSNPKLVHGYEKQIVAYEAAEASHHSTYLILQVNSASKKISDVQKLQGNLLRTKRPAPDVRVIDARRRLSASK